MKASLHGMVVTPTGDTSEYERGGLIVKLTENRDQKVYRGVVVDVGSHMEQDGLEPGAVAFYTDYWQVLDYHVVPTHHFLCFEPSDGPDEQRS